MVAVKATVLVLLACSAAMAGCATAPPPPVIEALHVQVRNESGAAIDLEIAVDDPADRRVLAVKKAIGPGAEVEWTALAPNATYPRNPVWHVDIDGTSRNRTLLMDAEGQSGAGWTIDATLCRGREAWVRFVAQEAHTSPVGLLDAPYAMLDGGSFSCDGIHWGSMGPGSGA
jgi:hypothetical protein